MSSARRTASWWRLAWLSPGGRNTWSRASCALLATGNRLTAASLFLERGAVDPPGMDAGSAAWRPPTTSPSCVRRGCGWHQVRQRAEMRNPHAACVGQIIHHPRFMSRPPQPRFLRSRSQTACANTPSPAPRKGAARIISTVCRSIAFSQCILCTRSPRHPHCLVRAAPVRGRAGHAMPAPRAPGQVVRPGGPVAQRPQGIDRESMKRQRSSRRTPWDHRYSAAEAQSAARLTSGSGGGCSGGGSAVDSGAPSSFGHGCTSPALIASILIPEGTDRNSAVLPLIEVVAPSVRPCAHRTSCGSAARP
jgi:hypothetical protein